MLVQEAIWQTGNLGGIKTSTFQLVWRGFLYKTIIYVLFCHHHHPNSNQVLMLASCEVSDWAWYGNQWWHKKPGTESKFHRGNIIIGKSLWTVGGRRQKFNHIIASTVSSESWIQQKCVGYEVIENQGKKGNRSWISTPPNYKGWSCLISGTDTQQGCMLVFIAIEPKVATDTGPKGNRWQRAPKVVWLLP